MLTVDGTTYAQTSAGVTAAIAALPAGGGQVHCTAGTYPWAGTVALPSNIVLSGEGPATYFKQNAGVNSHLLQATGQTGVTIRDLYLDGDKANQTAKFTNILLDTCTKSTIRDIWTARALRTELPAVGGLKYGEGISLHECTDCLIENVYTFENEYDGIKVRGSTHVIVRNIVARNNGGSGVQFALSRPADLPCDFCTMDGVTVFHSTGTPPAVSVSTRGIYIHKGRWCSVSNVISEGTQRLLGGTDTTEYNTFVNCTGRVRPGSGKAGIDFSDGSTCNFSSFSGVTVHGFSGASMKFTLFENGKGNTFTNCHFHRGSGTGTWTFDSGNATDTRFMDCTVVDGSGARKVMTSDNIGLV